MEMEKSSNKEIGFWMLTFVVRSIIKAGSGWFDNKTNESDSIHEDICAKASAWYHVTYHPRHWVHCKEE